MKDMWVNQVNLRNDGLRFSPSGICQPDFSRSFLVATE